MNAVVRRLGTADGRDRRGLVSQAEGERKRREGEGRGGGEGAGERTRPGASLQLWLSSASLAASVASGLDSRAARQAHVKGHTARKRIYSTGVRRSKSVPAIGAAKWPRRLYQIARVDDLRCAEQSQPY